jgi:hypothetical protein
MHPLQLIFSTYASLYDFVKLKMRLDCQRSKLYLSSASDGRRKSEKAVGQTVRLYVISQVQGSITTTIATVVSFGNVVFESAATSFSRRAVTD